MITLLETSYLLRVTLELIFLSLVSGVVGTLIVLRKRSFYAVALSHATFPGGVLAAVLGFSVMLGQAFAALVLSLLLAYLNRHPSIQQSSAQGATTGIVLSFGFALGALLSSLKLGNGVPIDALLVGSLFGVQISDILAAAGVTIFALLVLAMYGRQLLFATFDPLSFKAGGGKTSWLEIISTVLIAATIVVAMPALGAILAVALIIGPAATAFQIAPNVKWVPPLAVIFALLAGFSGFWASTQLELAAGGAIGLAVAIIFILVFLLKNFYAFGHLGFKKSVGSLRTIDRTKLNG